jgi:hypothetical protein
MAPVLVSARLTGRNVFSGETFRVPVSIVNDAEDGKVLTAGTLRWRFVVAGNVLSEGTVATPPVAYYANETVDVNLNAPARVPAGRANARLCFDLVVDGRVLSSNHYAYRIADRAWSVHPATSVQGRVVVYRASTVSKALFRSLRLGTADCRDLHKIRLRASDLLVIDGEVPGKDADALRAIIGSGTGRVLWVHPQAQAVAFFPEQILDHRRQDGEVVTMLVPESPAFDGVEIGDLAWMGGPSVKRIPVSSLGGYHVVWKNPALTVLAEEMKAHGYLTNPADKLESWVTPLVSIRKNGQTPVILSEMSVKAALTDPIALRLWANLIRGL